MILFVCRSSGSHGAVHRESGSGGTSSGSHNAGSMVHRRLEKCQFAATAIALSSGKN